LGHEQHMSNEPRKRRSLPLFISLLALITCTIGYASSSALIGGTRGATVIYYVPWLSDRRLAWAVFGFAVVLFFVVARRGIAWRKEVGLDPP
jgi:hypothetical protein